MRRIRVAVVCTLAWLYVLAWHGVEAAALPQAAPAEPAAVAVSGGPPQRSTAFDLTGRIRFC